MREVSFFLILILSNPSASVGQIIDFETLPDGSPVVDRMLISDQYSGPPFGVTFSLIGELPTVGPKIAMPGPPETAFSGPAVYSACSGESSDFDKPAPGEPVGCFFLTDDETFGEPPSLLITYGAPVRQASASIIDIDGQEEWTISALAQDSTVLNSVMLDAGNGIEWNGRAQQWSFDLQDDIHFIRIDYTGSGIGIGLAFDNFSPSSIPADLSITKSITPGPVAVGDTLTYDLTVTNAGPGSASGVVLEDFLPEGVALLSAAASQGSCSEVDGVVTCDLGTITNGAFASVQIIGRLDQVFVSNTAVVSATESDPEASNNSTVAGAEVACVGVSSAPSAVARGETRLYQNAPNPFSAATRVAFALKVRAHTEITIYDIAGRCVRRLLSKQLDNGSHMVEWDGLDDRGNHVSSGTYFYRLNVDGQPMGARKAIVLK